MVRRQNGTRTKGYIGQNVTQAKWYMDKKVDGTKWYPVKRVHRQNGTGHNDKRVYGLSY